MPFIIAAPGKGPRDRVDTRSVVSAVDWMPTVVNLAGIAMPADLQSSLRGHDISKTFIGQGSTVVRPESLPLMWEHRGLVMGPCSWQAPLLAVQIGDYKLLLD